VEYRSCIQFFYDRDDYLLNLGKYLGHCCDNIKDQYNIAEMLEGDFKA